MRKLEPSYERLLVIVHGMSELVLCKSIKSNLRLREEIISEKGGRNSIQINGLLHLLKSDSRFRSMSEFCRAFPGVETKGKLFVDFSLFTIMDTDDCTDQQRKAYESGRMFAGHWLAPYIVPIFNSPNLEQTMKDADIEVIKKKDYIKIFPTNHGDLDMDMARDFLRKLQKCKHSNLDKYVERCIDIADRQLKRNKDR